VPQTTDTPEMLAHYAEREPCAFLQYDGFDAPTGMFDDNWGPDVGGHEVIVGITYELMSGMATVRVLIPPESDADVAAALLRKIADRVERHGVADLAAMIDDGPRMRMVVTDEEADRADG
jgi:hypothetical protein